MRLVWSLLAVALFAALIYAWRHQQDGHEASAPAAATHATGAEKADGVAERPGPLLESVSKPDLRPPRPRPDSGPAPENVDPSGTVDVRVLAPDMQLVPHFEARLLEANGVRTPQRGKAAGGIAITAKAKGVSAIEPGSVLEVWGARDAPGRSLGLAPQRVGPFRGDESTLDVVLEPGRLLEGRILGPDGPLGEQVKVRLRAVDGWRRWDAMGLEYMTYAGPDAASGMALQLTAFGGEAEATTTDAEGAFRLPLLRPGLVHRVTVHPPEGYAAPDPVEVREGDPPVEIRLRALIAVRVTVLGPDQQPLGGAHVAALPRGSNGFDDGLSAQTQADGVARLGGGDTPRDRGGLDPNETYKLVVNAVYGPGIVRDERWPRLRGHAPRPANAPSLAEKAMEAWTPADTVVRLDRGYTVSGVVLDDEGEPCGGRHVGLCTPVGFGCYTTGGDGRFEFRGVPACTICIGLDHGGGMGGIVDDLRERMWAASYGDPQRGLRDPGPQVRAWQTLDIASDRRDLTLRLPRTVGVDIVLPPGTEVGAERRGEHEPIAKHDATSVIVLKRNSEGWAYHDAFSPERDVFTGARRVRLGRLLPGHAYAAWMTPVDGKYVYVEFDADVGKLALQREAGHPIQGRIRGRPREASPLRFQVRDDRSRFLRTMLPDAEGRFHVAGLPDSTWTVSAWCRGADDLVWKAEGKVRTGGSIDLTLVPQREPDAR